MLAYDDPFKCSISYQTRAKHAATYIKLEKARTARGMDVIESGPTEV